VVIDVSASGAVSNDLNTISETATVNISGSYLGVTLSGEVTASLDVTDPSAAAALACYAAGTRIATPAGARAIETLVAGDLVMTASGGTRPVVWVGHRDVDCGRHPVPADMWPVRVCAGAFGDGRPQRDLRLSPNHAVFVDGVLIPVRHLLNGRTIAQEPSDRVGYWHVELDRHDVMLAEGLPCESYLDTGNRGAFANGGAVVQIQPDFALRVWEAEACAPLVLDGAALHGVRARLLDQAARLGHALTDDPELRVLADGRALPAAVAGAWRHVRLPDGARLVRLVSRGWVPAWTGAGMADPRRLGVAVAALRLDGREVSLDSAAMLSGWHTAEAGWRWTDGEAVLAVDGVRDLSFAIAMTGRYWREVPQGVVGARIAERRALSARPSQRVG
jgi:hypothetical protein